MGSPEEVYHNPVSVFVLNFLGSINIFHARSEGGKASEGVKPKRIYVRPHQLTVTRAAVTADSVKASVIFINPAGSVVKIDARSADGNIYQVEIPQEEYRALKLSKNDEVFLTPKNITYSEYEI